jgi:hypothetical protein
VNSASTGAFRVICFAAARWVSKPRPLSPCLLVEMPEAARIMGKRDYRSKLKKLGLEKIQSIARGNGKKSGRAKKAEANHERENDMRQLHGEAKDRDGL